MKNSGSYGTGRTPLAAVLLAMSLLLAACQGTDQSTAQVGEAAPEQDRDASHESEVLLPEPDAAAALPSAPDIGVDPVAAGVSGEDLTATPDALAGETEGGFEEAGPVAEPATEPLPPAGQDLPVPTSAEPAIAEPDPIPVEEAAPAEALVELPAPEPVVAATVPEPLVVEPEPVPEPLAVQPEPAAPVTQAPAAETLDLDSLETKLRKTKAIGMFTKLELKNQVEDLIKEVDDYHRNRSQLSLTDLEERFDLLVMKLLLLLQDGDPPLHHAIASARPTLWTTLADPNQFATVRGT